MYIDIVYNFTIFIMEFIIYKFSETINDYIQHIIQSKLLNNVDNPIYLSYIGLNTIIHIFKITLQNSKNIYHTFYCCQKAYYFYLEYIEQMNKTNILHNLNNLDAIIFIFKKTMEDMSNVSNANIVMLEKEFISVNDSDIHYALYYIPIITKKLLFFSDELFFESGEHSLNTISQNIHNITIEQIQFISNKYLNKYLLMILHPAGENNIIDDLFYYIYNIKDKMNLSYDEYIEFLNENYKHIKKMKAKNIFPTKNMLNIKYLKHFCIDENRLQMKQMLQQNKMKTFSKLIFTFDE